MSRSGRQLLLYAAVPAAVFLVLINLVGVDRFVTTLVELPHGTIALLVAIALVGIVAFGLTFHVVGRRLGLGLSPHRSISLYTVVILADHLTPFGQAGGEPVGAYIIARRTGRPYERCLGTLSAVDVINFLPAIAVFIAGGGYLALIERSIPPGLRPIAGAFSLLVVAVVTVVGSVYVYPTRARRLLHRLIERINRALSWVPWVDSIESDQLHRRIDGYATTLATIAGDRRTIALAGGFAMAAFVAQGLVLWVAVGAIGPSISLVLAVVIVPVSLMAAVIPLPGGGGGIEGIQIALLGIFAGLSPETAITAVVLSRGIVYWLPVVLGTGLLGIGRLRG